MVKKGDASKIEQLLENILIRLDRLENILRTLSIDPVSSLAIELALTYAEPAHKAVKLARKVVEVERRLGEHDPIARAIVEALAVKEKPMTLSELTREVRMLRGTASRRIITERVRKLESKGIVKTKRTGRKTLVHLERSGSSNAEESR